MTLKRWLFINAILFIALGIAFALYAPLAIDMFGVLNTQGSSEMYWFTVSFARLYGAALFGFGFLTWAVSNFAEALTNLASARRGVVVAMLLANGMGLVVSTTQQVSIWGAATGWIMVGLYGTLMVGYIAALATRG